MLFERTLYFLLKIVTNFDFCSSQVCFTKGKLRDLDAYYIYWWSNVNGLS